MLDTLLYGSILMAFGPLAALMVLVLAFRPALAVIAMASSFVTLIPVQLTSFVYMIVVKHFNPSGSPSSYSLDDVQAADAGRGWIVVMGVLFQEAFRLLLAYALVKAEWYFRKHHQVLFASRIRMIPVGVAHGVGVAVTLSLLTHGAYLDGAVAIETAAVPAVHNQAVHVDFGACPQLPYAMFQGLAWFFVSMSQVAWSVMMVVGVAAFLGEPTPASTTTTTNGAAEAAPVVPATSPIPPHQRAPIPRPTTFRPCDGIGFVAGAVVLHLVSSTVTLVNSRAYDWTTFENVPGRGCVVSLPIQAIIATMSVGCAMAMANLDVAKRINADDI